MIKSKYLQTLRDKIQILERNDVKSKQPKHLGKIQKKKKKKKKKAHHSSS